MSIVNLFHRRLHNNALFLHKTLSASLNKHCSFFKDITTPRVITNRKKLLDPALFKVFCVPYEKRQ